MWFSVVDEEGVSLATVILVMVAFVSVLPVIGQTDSKLLGEEAHTAEMARSATRVELSSSKHEPGV
jgi:hypothetical protein